VLCAEAGIGCGRDVGLSDQDGDGSAELFVSAHQLDDTNEDDGAVLIFAGTLSGDLTEADATARILGLDGAAFAGSMLLTDLDGDGVDDLAASDRAGTLYVFTGGLDEGTTADAESEATGASALGVAGAADLDGDALPDLLLTDVDRAWVLAADRSVLLDVTAAGDVALLVDLDASGALDLCVGDADAPNGAVRIFADPSTGSLTGADATLTRTGAAAGDLLGATLARLPDIDADGRDELLVGAPGADSVETDDGFVHVLLGAELP
jgi:FG-GAP repeat